MLQNKFNNKGNSNSEMPKNSIAKLLRKFSKIIIAVISILFGIVGALFGYEEEPLELPIDYMYEDYANAFIFLAIGLAVGAIIGFLSTMIILYFAELGENTKITAQSTSTAAQQSGNEEINNANVLEKYKELLENNVITQEEFDQKKKQLLNL